MTNGVQAAGPGEARYADGMAHLQAGRWPEAIACFEGLLRRDPADGAARHALEEAQFKASLDAAGRVRAKRWILPAGDKIARFVVLALLLVGLVYLGSVVRERVGPRLAQALEVRRIARLQGRCADLVDAWKLDEADACYQELLAAAPGLAAASQGQDRVADRRLTQTLYEEGVALQASGDYGGALARFNQVKAREPRFPGDVEQRILQVQRRQELDELFAQALVAAEEGRLADALSFYEQLAAQDVGYRREAVHAAQYGLHMQLGRALLEEDPPAAERVPQALEHFRAALTLEPRDPEATAERDLAQLFVSGQARYEAGQWEEAIGPLRALYDQRPGYLRGLVVGRLYEAYVEAGKQLWAGGDCNSAYARNQAACDLPVADRALCRAGLSQAQPCLTPTPTPSATPTPTPVPTATPWPTWTPIPPPAKPTPLPTPINLAQYRDKILFVSENEAQPGLWVMDPDGRNRRYLGQAQAYRKQYDALRAAEALSPDGQSRALTSTGPDARSPQIFVLDPPHPSYGQLPPRQITFHTALSYDPVWSPDWSHIAYVSIEGGSDDIWLVQPDGEDDHWLVRNPWEWDKHPSWSPDSRRIVFWSNRNLTKQIWVMEADGRNPINISNTQWDEYDPIWVK